MPIVKIQLQDKRTPNSKLKTVSRCFKGDKTIIRSYIKQYPTCNVFTTETLADDTKRVVKWEIGVNC